MYILVLNAGSSSQKSALYALGDGADALPPPGAPAPRPLWQAEADWSAPDSPASVSVTTAGGATLNQSRSAGGRADMIGALLETLWSGPTQVIARPQEIAVVGHRVVHGGPRYTSSVRVTPEVEREIERFAAFAPAHNPANLEGVRAVERILGNVPQVAAFDTAFHASMPLANAAYPGPYDWLAHGIRRYGFHGLSHQYCAERAAGMLGRDPGVLRLVTCHLGNGCSLDAIQGGTSVETTMGMTPLDGLMMGSRSGSVDPGILIYLQRQGWSADQLDTTLNTHSGLRGISGVSSDLRAVLKARAEGDERARLAFDMYVQRIRAGIGALAATLGGLDALVFAGGVGEHSAETRAAACQTLAFLGVALDPDANASASPDTDIALANASVRTLVIHTEEDWMIARDCWRILRA